ncbi:hypothetical protein D516_1217 [Rhodobacter sp. AKP1]|nr:hypothetical protein D516_1217 [Rhodobacter sp. AKP1]
MVLQWVLSGWRGRWPLPSVPAPETRYRARSPRPGRRPEMSSSSAGLRCHTPLTPETEHLPGIAERMDAQLEARDYLPSDTPRPGQRLGKSHLFCVSRAVIPRRVLLSVAPRGLWSRDLPASTEGPEVSLAQSSPNS